MKRRKSIRTRIIVSIWCIVVPMTILFSMAIGYFYMSFHRYNKIVNNITQANEYNMTFKENMDSVIYHIVVGSIRYNEPKEHANLGMRDPYIQIDRARRQFQQLKERTTDREKLTTLREVLGLLNTLEQRVDDIVNNVKEGGHYDKNMQMFNMDISILTGLIQDSIQRYIYESAIEMGKVQREINGRIMFFIRIMIVIFAVLLIISIVISKYTTDRIIKPIDNMCRVTESYAVGDFSKKLEVKNNNELDVLANSFNNMGDDIENLIKTVGEEQKEKQSLEMKLLTAEINPHFLYNTLDTIVWLTEAKENDEAVKVLSYLSDFFRVSLSNGRDVITVGEEETHINSYLAIQEIRFSDMMDYEISIDDEIKDCQMVKMTLQPLVENAIYHGIRGRRKKGIIRVTGKDQGSYMVFTVEDTGRGMTAEELDDFRQRLLTGKIMQSAEGHGFGVANVVTRLHLYYGSDMDITVKSVVGRGTIIKIVLPKSVQ
ncbi:MAG: sensor histidine kinase [Lachnospiraceae bacterium]|uniref:histidine kinase n=1 Tax=Candidatus Weimeria bifida TaxID=2599074 RepID=A0A6N7J431_9FIRM|nr:sensor histidine kinase [Candidatus Weimeria bifida]RRF96169.1 MAG: sensor histidine kinase [Lachnospiraceae bacterium]